MNPYEELVEKARKEGLIVKEFPLKSSDGRIKGNRIAIRNDISTIQKADALAEELGHHHTTVGNIVDQEDSNSRKQERQARFWGYNARIGLRGLIKAYEHGCKNSYEIAEYLQVTEGQLVECIQCYRDKYGVFKRYCGYYIYFIPHLTVIKTDYSCEFAEELAVAEMPQTSINKCELAI